MSEQSILDYASQPNEVMAALGQDLQRLISLANEAAILLGQRRAGRARKAAASSEAERRQFQQRQRALYEADRLVWRPTMKPRFWDRATPEQIVRAWEACAPWAAEGFPAAQEAMRNMCTKIEDRFGVQVDFPKMRAGDLARLLGAEPSAAADEAGPGGNDAVPVPAGKMETVSYRIREPSGDVIAADVVHLGRGEGAGTARLIAADALTAVPHARPDLVVEVVPGDDPHAATTPLFALDHGASEQAMREHRELIDAGHAGDERAAAFGTGAEQVAESLRFEQRKLRARLRTDPRGDERGQIADAGLRLRAVQADQRGESGAAVIWSAALSAELDEQWWQEATDNEIGALWEEANRWGPGAGRDHALDHLRDGMHRHHGIEVPRDASSEEVRTALAEQTQQRRKAEADKARPTDDRPDHRRSGAEDERRWRNARSTATVQNRAAAAVYEQMANSETPGVAEAAAAGHTVAHAYPAPPSARVDRAAQQGPPGRFAEGPERAPARVPQQRSDSPSR